MQYPVIDLIADAYINNGWTGLELTHGKNLAYIEYIRKCPSISSGVFIDYSNAMTTNRINIDNSYYTISINSDVSNITYAYCFLYNSLGEFIRYDTIDLDSLPITINYSNVSYIYIRFDFGSYATENMKPLIQVEKGTEATPYEPYSEPKNDFPTRLKLPLPHYFPHSVIDALQRAAAGTQTADDTEILKHYLTPLGIGGI